MSRLYESGLQALRELHKIGIANCDIGWSKVRWNALIVSSEGGTEERVVLVDFGFAVMLVEEEVSNVEESQFDNGVRSDVEDWKGSFRTKRKLEGQTEIEQRNEYVTKFPLTLGNFPHRESDVKFLKILGKGNQGYVYRIAYGGEEYACKIHLNQDVSQECFYREAHVYAKTSDMQPISIARYYRYIKFAQRPKVNHLHQASEVDDSPLVRPIFGIALENIEFRKFEASDLALGSGLESSGRQILQELHAKGIIHNDATGDGNRNGLIVGSEDGSERVVMIDFGSAFMQNEGIGWEGRKFQEMARSELEYWNRQFN